MESTAQNAPLFIEKFYDGCETLRQLNDGKYVPDDAVINETLRKNEIGYQIQNGTLRLRESLAPPIPVATRSPSLADKAIALFEESLRTSEGFLDDRQPRQAVQEILWLLETVTTAFRGVQTEAGPIEGRYFNNIVTDLRKKRPNPTLNRVLEWVTNIHGYLSSPTGGGVRHGTDLSEGVELDLNQSRLICNLVRSYISFFISEHQALSRDGGSI